MLEPWIIEQIRRREEEERRKNERPQLEIPSGDERSDHWRKRDEAEDGEPGRQERDRDDRDGNGRREDDPPKRGVMIIDFGVS